MIVELSMMLADSGMKRLGPAKQWLVFKDMLIPVVCVAYNGETVCSTAWDGILVHPCNCALGP